MSEAGVRQLDRAWNEAYIHRDWAALERILADDWLGFTPDHGAITKETLLEAQRRASPDAKVQFEQGSVHLFGHTAVSTGRVRVETPERSIDQRYMRVYAFREGRWWAVAVQVMHSSEPT